MIYKAFSSFTDELLRLPETGMGYQIIDAIRLGRTTKERFVIYNGHLIVDLDNNFNSSKRQIVSESYTKMFSKSNYLTLTSPTLVSRSEVRNVRMFSESAMTTKGRHSGGIGASSSPKQYANGTDIYVRLSQYEEDIRIDMVNKKLKSGAYTTTKPDYLSCKAYNDDPVDRYALPSDEIIQWAFEIQPKSYDQLRLGIVQPANNHNGGGIEALFDDGTSNGTLIDKHAY